MYKVAGAQDDNALRANDGTAYSFDRAGLFDGTIGHVPGDSKLAVDRVYEPGTTSLNSQSGFPSVGSAVHRRNSEPSPPGQLEARQLWGSLAPDRLCL